MAKLGSIFNKEEIKKEEQHPRRLLKIKRKCRTVLSGT